MKILRKYFSGTVSLLLLYTLLFTNVSLCEVLLQDCAQMKQVSCCENDSKSSSQSDVSMNSCCCVIKEATTQPAEVPVNITKTHQKSLFYSLCISNPYGDAFEKSYEIAFSVTHPPPLVQDLCIFNSVFRI